MVILHKINYLIRYTLIMEPFFLSKDDKNCTIDKKVRIETYGCQMNVADSEVVATMMSMAGYELTEDDNLAAAVLINTCSIRDNAEQKIYGRITYWNSLRRKLGRHIIIGVIGCMAERLKERLIEEYGVDIVAGPDAYLDLPNLVGAAETGNKAINIDLSTTETYRDIIEPQSILNELADLRKRGFKEAILLGQNVNSYKYEDAEGNVTDFTELLRIVAEAAPDMRIRFTTSHPKDMSDATIEMMARYANIAKHIHLPVQSGSNSVLKAMNRKYTREWYLDRIAAIRRVIPDCGISTDMFTGFHDESEQDFCETLSLMKEVGFDSSFMFKYSERPGTYASKHLPDNISEEVKIERLNRMIDLQNELSLKSNQNDIGKVFEVLVEGVSKRSANDLFGRTSQNKVAVFAKGNHKPGEFVKVKINSVSSATLLGEIVE